MVTTTHGKDSVPELVQLGVRLLKPNDPDSKEEVRVELRVNSAPLEINERETYDVSLMKLTLSLDVSGFAIEPGSKRGEPTRPPEVIKTETVVTEFSRTGGAGAKGGLTLGVAEQSLKIQGEASGSVTNKESVSTTKEDRHILVIAKGNDTWEVSEPPWAENKRLNSKYLNDDPLCLVTKQDRANLHTVDLIAYARQRDLCFDPTHNKLFGGLLTPIDKLLGVILAKAISRDQPYRGVVTFSHVVVDVED